MLITTSLSFTLLLLSCFSFSPCTLSALSPPCVPTVPAMWPPCCHPASALATTASGSLGSGVMAGSRGGWQCHNPAVLACGAPSSSGGPAWKPGANSPYRCQIHFPLNIPSLQPWKLVGGTRN